MLDQQLYLACLDLTERKVVVIGSGPMADEKIEGLRACGASVEHVEQDRFTPELLDDAYLVITATDDRAFDRIVYDEAEARAMFVNVADVPELCNFILPAIARRGPLSVAISTNGASPALAKRMRTEAHRMFDAAYARLAEILDELRPWAKEALPDYGSRRDFFDGIVNGEPDPIDLLRDGREDEVMASIAAAKERV